MQQSNTTVIVQQPQATNDKLVTTKFGHRDWSSGLFSCFDDVGNCLMTLFCHECVMAQLSARAGECCCVTCCVSGGLVALRARIRTMGGIRGSICNDYMAMVCCYTCAVCQMHRELDHMGL